MANFRRKRAMIISSTAPASKRSPPHPLWWQTLNGSLPLTFTPGCSQWLAGPLTPVPVAAACNHAFVIPSAVHRARGPGGQSLAAAPRENFVAWATV